MAGADIGLLLLLRCLEPTRAALRVASRAADRTPAEGARFLLLRLSFADDGFLRCLAAAPSPDLWYRVLSTKRMSLVLLLRCTVLRPSSTASLRRSRDRDREREPWRARVAPCFKRFPLLRIVVLCLAVAVAAVAVVAAAPAAPAAAAAAAASNASNLIRAGILELSSSSSPISPAAVRLSRRWSKTIVLAFPMADGAVTTVKSFDGLSI